MTDVHDRQTRSFNMSQIKSKDTKPEILVRKFLFAKGFRYRLHVKTLPGKPDIVFPKLKTVIFVHGCFWHGHQNCPLFILPKTRTEWWQNKINRNKKTDERNADNLLQLGWTVLTIFGCELKPKKREKALAKIAAILKQIELQQTG